MSHGLQVLNSSGAVVWDSTQVSGGVVVDVKTYAAAATATLTYPSHVGRSVVIIPLLAGYVGDVPNIGVTTDVALGYPRVNVAAGAVDRRFMVLVY